MFYAAIVKCTAWSGERYGISGLSGKFLGSERSVSRSREPSQHSRGESSVRVDTSVYIPAHQRDRRIGESNSDSRRKEFYDQRRKAGSSRDHGHDYAKDRDRGKDYSKDYGKDKDRDRHKGTVRDQRSIGRDPTPDRRSNSREKVDEHKKRAGDSRDKRDGQDTRERQRDYSPHPARDRSRNYKCTQVDDDYTNVCAFFDAAPVAKEADRADDRLLSASIPHPSRNPRILAYMLMFCLTQERGRQTISMKRRRLGFGQWALNARNVVLRCVVV